MEVIFDTTMLRPVLSPTMKATLSVISLIANTLVQTGKCMRERQAAEAGQPSTLDDVMKQSGLNIPGLEEALAQLMGGGDGARQAASTVVNNPDPANLLQAFASMYAGMSRPTKSGPIVTPPPGPASGAAPYPGPVFAPAAPPMPTRPATPEPARAADLDAFLRDFTRGGHEAARSSPASTASTGLPLFRPDFTREGREAANAAANSTTPGTIAANTAASPSLVAVVKRQLDAMRAEKAAHERAVAGRLAAMEMQLAELYAEWRQLIGAAQARAEAPIAASGAAAPPAECSTSSSPVADLSASKPVATPAAGSDAANDPALEPLPSAATAEEVVQAIELIDAFAEETRLADDRQLARIAAVEQEVAVMRSVVRQAREAHAAATAHR